MKISIRFLKKHGACVGQVELFRETFGSGVHETTIENLAQAVNARLTIDWLEQFIPPGPIRAEYERQRVPIWAEYERQRAPILAEYERQHAPILAEYERQRAPILAEYERQRALIRAEYERQHALILSAALQGVES